MTRTEYREIVAGEVRAAVARAGLSANTIAERAGLPASTYSRKSRALSPFSVDELVAIADALNVDPAGFFPRAEVATAA